MSLKVGDPVFTSDALPGLLHKKDEAASKTIVDTDLKSVKQHFRHGYIKGLNDVERSTFNGVMDEIKGTPEDMQKVEKLHAKIQDLEHEPTVENMKLARYLKAELFHLMSSSQVSPRYREQLDV